MDNSGTLLADCKKGRLYKFRARNFSVGVFDGNRGFIGIREKFGDIYLATEYHWDADLRHGTVRDIQDTGIHLPDGILAVESLGTIDRKTGRSMAFDRPVDDGGKGWYFIDTEEPGGPDVRPVYVENEPLLNWLQKHKNV